jgi:ATP-dependent Clp protease adaptor protein ClpS
MRLGKIEPMAENEQSPLPVAKVKTKPARKRRRKSKQLPKFNVILLNDDDHSYAYVIEMLVSLFAHDEEKAYQMAKEVDTTGRVIVYTTHRELAELKRDQIHSWGMDWRIENCKGSMTSFIEPAS